MPTYDYLCEACGHAFELFQSFRDDPIVECPSCAGVVRRVIAPTPVIFRGSGWYATDSKRPTAGLTTGKAAEAKTEAVGKAEKAETSPATEPAASHGSGGAKEAAPKAD